MFHLGRTCWDATGGHHAVRYGITSLPPHIASAAALLALCRGHWTIENRLHYVNDVSLGEDRCTVRMGAASAMLAIGRDLAISLLRRDG